MNEKCLCKKKSRGKNSRRTFIKTISGAAASVVLFGNCKSTTSDNSGNTGNQNPVRETHAPRTPRPNPYVTGDGRPILVAVTGTDFAQMLRTGLNALGGLGLLLGPNQDVLIKPNYNNFDPYPATTSPSSLADIVREARAVTGGDVGAGDEGYVASSIVYSQLGLETLITGAGGRLVSFSSTYDVRQDTWANLKPDFLVYQDVYDAPVIINTCVLKRHHTADLTCSLKNNVGVVDGTQMTGTRYYLHREADSFFVEVAEIAALVRPELNIVDARSILTVNGPTIDLGVVEEGVNKVILCGDMVATDTYCGQLMETYDPNFVVGGPFKETLDRAEQLGLGTGDLSQVEIIEINA